MSITSKDNSVKIPVAIFTFRKHEFLEEIFARIIDYNPPKLYIFQDKFKNTEDLSLTEKVSEIIRKTDFPFEVEYVFQKAHLGLNPSIHSSLNHVFGKEERLIILEDDTVPSASFFLFCQEMLHRYENNPEIGCINGCNLNAVDLKDSFFLSGFGLPFWGWATWKNKWELHSETTIPWKNFNKQFLSKARYDTGFLRFFFNNMREDNIIWDVKWSWILMINRQKVIFPGVNLVTNKGFVNHGSYTNYTVSKFNDLKRGQLDIDALKLVNSSDPEKKYQKKTSILLQEIVSKFNNGIFTRRNVFLSKLNLK